MSFSFNTKNMGNKEFEIVIHTDNKQYYEHIQRLCRECIDNTVDKPSCFGVTDPEEGFICEDCSYYDECKHKYNCKEGKYDK